MNIFNDSKIAFGTIVNSVKNQQLSVSFVIKSTFSIQNGQSAKWADEPDFLSGDVYNEDDLGSYLIYTSDFAPYKPRGDLLLTGSAYAPESRSVFSLNTQFQVGNFSKTLTVVGKRTWKQSFPKGLTLTEPQAFDSMPLTYEVAFGGTAFSKNPVGCGYRTENAPCIVAPHAVPCGPEDNQDPAGYAPLNSNWQQRYSLTGSYDEAWIESHWPWFPQDFDWGYFNAAPPDQQLSGYLVGNEEITLENLHSQHPRYQTRLPGIRVRCFINEIQKDKTFRFREVPLVLDTLFIDMEKEKLNLVWRGVAEASTLKLKEIEHVLIVTEQLTDPVESLESYQVLLHSYTTKKTVPAASDADPAEVAAFEKQFADMELEMDKMEAVFADAETEIEQAVTAATKIMDQQKVALIAEGVDLGLLENPQPQSTPGFGDIIKELKNDPQLAAQLKPEDFAQLEKAQTEIEKIQEEAEQFENEMKELEKEFEQSQEIAWSREKVRAAILSNKSLAEQDLTGLDLSELDFFKVDFSAAILSNTNLQKAILVRADLRKVNLNGADLTGADLTGAVLDEADLSEAVLTDAILLGLSLNATTLVGLNLAGADFSKSTGKATDFSSSNLTEAIFSESQFPQADFSNCKLDRAVFTEAQLQAAQFCGASASGINMENANITKLHGNEGANFTAASFKYVQGEGAIFEESTLDRANFSCSVLTDAQFSETSLHDAVFDRVEAASAVFDDALMQGVTITDCNMLRSTFDRADLTNGNLQGSNFFEAGFWNSVIKDTNFYAANLKNTLLG